MYFEQTFTLAPSLTHVNYVNLGRGFSCGYVLVEGSSVMDNKWQGGLVRLSGASEYYWLDWILFCDVAWLFIV